LTPSAKNLLIDGRRRGGPGTPHRKDGASATRREETL
jgi:hypothetical protein